MLTMQNLLFLFSIISPSIYLAKDCSYTKKCNPTNPNMINIHLIPHTHDDAGWLKTVDQYYIGSRKSIDSAGVQYIIDSVMHELYQNPTRKFSYVEGSFMQRWLANHDTQRHQIQNLVDDGRLEILSGGWVMNDEACAHYSDIITQMTLGFKIYKDAFGECGIPRTGWQIDPFGHSAAQADLFTRFGFDGTFYGRVSDTLKDWRSRNRSLEFLWHYMPDFDTLYETPENVSKLISNENTNNIDTKTWELFIGILPNLYQPPTGFCFDIFCNDEPIQDDITLKDYNVDERIESFLNQMISQARMYDTNHLIVTMGSDFHYQAAGNWFANLDRLIKHINRKRTKNGSDIQFNALYSTPGCYLYALNEAKNGGQSTNSKTLDKSQKIRTNKTLLKKNNGTTFIPLTRNLADPTINYSSSWPQKFAGDFFPLQNYYTNVWTGYFTSRPTLKGMIRDASRFLHICRAFDVLADLMARTAQVRALEKAVSLTQHHDAVTGTAKQAVTFDYMQRLHEAKQGCEEVIEEALQTLNIVHENQKVEFCHLLNISICPATTSLGGSQSQQKLTLLMYNPLAWDMSTHFEIPIVSGADIRLLDDQDSQISIQISDIPESVLRIPERKNHNGDLRGQPPSSNINSPQTVERIDEYDRILTDKYRNFPLSPGERAHFLSNLPTQSLNFPAKLPAMSVTAYHLYYQSKNRDSKDNFDANGINQIRKRKQGLSDVVDDPQSYVLENSVLRITFDPQTKLLSRIDGKDMERPFSLNVRQSYMWYGQPYTHANKGSGAYIFLANAPEANNISRWMGTDNTAVQLEIIKGPVFQQARQRFTPFLYLETTLYVGDNNIDFIVQDWTVGPLPRKDAPNSNAESPKDFILRWETDLQTATQEPKTEPYQDQSSPNNQNSTLFNNFYTDSNARFMVPRSVPILPDKKLRSNTFISTQYYPINSKIFIRDEKDPRALPNQTTNQRFFGIITDRAQGASALDIGSVEIMIHRRTIADDWLGVGEPLNELGSDNEGLIARGRFLVLCKSDKEAFYEGLTRLAQQTYLRPEIMFADESKLASPLRFLTEPMQSQFQWQFIRNSLPSNIHLLTLAQWNQWVLIRFEHIYSPKEHSQLSKPVTIDFKDLFKSYTIGAVYEKTLGANQDPNKVKRFVWPTEPSQNPQDIILLENSHQNTNNSNIDNSTKITLLPLDIKTFLIKLNARS